MAEFAWPYHGRMNTASVSDDGGRAYASAAKDLHPDVASSIVRFGLTLLVSSGFLVGNVACSKWVNGNATRLASETEESVGCASFEDTFWDGLYRFPMRNLPLPSVAQMKMEFERAIATGRFEGLNASAQQELAEALTDLYRLLANDSVRILSANPETRDALLETLASLEMGDRTTPEKQALQEKIRAKFAEIGRLAQDAGTVTSSSQCASPTPQPAPGQPGPSPPPVKSDNLLDTWKATRHPAVYGGLKSLATGYQSCEAGQIAELDDLTTDAVGVVKTEKHPDGIGWLREIDDLEAFIESHPYLSAYVKPASDCHDVLSKPMIYDYGGKPYAASETATVLDFFTNSGTGSAELGVDCSGYVYTAFAIAGLKVKESGRLKATGVYGVNSAMFMYPQSNGLTCLDYPTFTATESLRPGDVLASSGHTLLIETVGEDPFGIGHLTTAGDCKSSNISIARFNFTILQSSPSKGDVGINRMDAAHYFSSGGSMSDGLVQHAVNACKAKFQGPIKTSSPSANLIRHEGTPECIDAPLQLAREECVASCQLVPPSQQPIP